MDVMELTTRKAWVPPGDAGRVRILDAKPEAVKVARDWAYDLAYAAGHPAADDIREVTSELATNALLHACPHSVPCYAVRIDLDPRCCVVDVIDRCPRRVPAIRWGGHAEESGRGIHMVSTLASHWNVFTPVLSKTPPTIVKVVRAVFYV